MNILIINPPVREWAKPNCVPLGLGYIASSLRLAGHSIEVLDVNAYRYSKKLNQKYRLKFIVPKSEIYERQFKKRLSNSYVDYINILMPACCHLGQYFSTKRHLIFLKNIVYFLARLLQGFYMFLLYDCVRVGLLIKKYKPDFLYINNSGYPASDFYRAAALSASISSTQFFFILIILLFL